MREAVAARYESSVSYHEFLAQEAERALLQAQAEAEVAARSAQAVAAAQMKLLEEAGAVQGTGRARRNCCFGSRRRRARAAILPARWRTSSRPPPRPCTCGRASRWPRQPRLQPAPGLDGAVV